MIYKKYELSLSLNGIDIVHIARNSFGNVVFRENSEKALKKIIDGSEKKIDKSEEKVIEESVEPELKKDDDVEETLIPSTKSVTRGPDGKFISKSQLDTDEDLKKKTFWDKLTS